MEDNQKYNHLTDPLRNRCITASLVGVILGNNPHMTPDDAMRSMVRDAMGAEREFTGNIATEYGNNHEAGAIIEFQMETGLIVTKARFETIEDWAGVSPDGWVSDGWGLECKCPFSLRKGGEFKPIADQPHYMDQVQFSLWVTGREGWHFFQWAPHNTKLECVWPDQDWRDRNLPVLRQFFTAFLWEIENNAEDHLAPKRITIDTPQASKMVREYEEIVEQAELLAERKADLLKEMVALAGEKNALFSGRKLTLTRREGAVSYKKALDHFAPGADTSAFKGKASEFWGLK